MVAQGVEAVDCVSVDNALVIPGDPLFAGHCWTAGTDCGVNPRRIFSSISNHL